MEEARGECSGQFGAKLALLLPVGLSNCTPDPDFLHSEKLMGCIGSRQLVHTRRKTNKMPKNWQKRIQDYLVRDDGVCRILFIRTLPAPIHSLGKLTVGVLLCCKECYGLLRLRLHRRWNLAQHVKVDRTLVITQGAIGSGGCSATVPQK